MSEISISREEAIKNLNTFIEFMKNTQNDSDNPYFWSKEDYLSFAKAISDMEKLEKIEQIINSWDSDIPRDIIHWEKMRIIEQIMKGEK